MHYSVSRAMKSVLKMFTYCAGAENIHTHTREGYWKFWEMGGGGQHTHLVFAWMF